MPSATPTSARERPELDVIHAVGLDFRVLPKGEATYPHELARAKLAAVYLNVFRAFLRLYENTFYQIRRLRLLPLSAGIFVGDLLPDIPKLTFEALEDAIRSLSDPQREVLEELEVALHVFREDEWGAFVESGSEDNPFVNCHSDDDSDSASGGTCDDADSTFFA